MTTVRRRSSCCVAAAAAFNAAVAQENLKRYGAATELYERIVREYPRSSFVDDALFRTAVNSQRFFEFDKAALAYQTLATSVGQALQQSLTDSARLAADTMGVPTILLAPGLLSVRLFDRLHYRGVASRETADAVQWREAIDAVLQRSEEAFPATTLGL